MIGTVHFAFSRACLGSRGKHWASRTACLGWRALVDSVFVWVKFRAITARSSDAVRITDWSFVSLVTHAC